MISDEDDNYMIIDHLKSLEVSHQSPPGCSGHDDDDTLLCLMIFDYL